jgi:hypothetical protein
MAAATWKHQHLAFPLPTSVASATSIQIGAYSLASSQTRSTPGSISRPASEGLSGRSSMCEPGVPGKCISPGRSLLDRLRTRPNGELIQINFVRRIFVF